LRAGAHSFLKKLVSVVKDIKAFAEVLRGARNVLTLGFLEESAFTCHLLRRSKKKVFGAKDDIAEALGDFADMDIDCTELDIDCIIDKLGSVFDFNVDLASFPPQLQIGDLSLSPDFDLLNAGLAELAGFQDDVTALFNSGVECNEYKTVEIEYTKLLRQVRDLVLNVEEGDILGLPDCPVDFSICSDIRFDGLDQFRSSIRPRLQRIQESLKNKRRLSNEMTRSPSTSSSPDCGGFCLAGGGIYPFGCNPNLGVEIVQYRCGSGGGCQYFGIDEVQEDDGQWCTFKSTQQPMTSSPSVSPSSSLTSTPSSSPTSTPSSSPTSTPSSSPTSNPSSSPTSTPSSTDQKWPVCPAILWHCYRVPIQDANDGPYWKPNSCARRDPDQQPDNPADRLSLLNSDKLSNNDPHSVSNHKFPTV
ncbi:hypothetical protein THAOC_06859, partial [Thalassiosira oceanica]